MKGIFLALVLLLGVGFAALHVSPYWSMAGMAQALCSKDKARLEGYLDRSRLNVIERAATRTILAGRVCPSRKNMVSDLSTAELARQIFDRTEIEWLTASTIRVKVVDSESRRLATLLIERNGLNWRLVDIGG